MGRPTVDRKTELSQTHGQTHGLGGVIRVVRDLIVVVGANPYVWRVLGTKRGSVTGFEMESVDGERFTGGSPWPRELFPATMRLYREGLVIPADLLASVEVIHVWAGNSMYGTTCQGYWLWQSALPAPLCGLTLLEGRAAITSPWLNGLRQRTRGARGILLREE